MELITIEGIKLTLASPVQLSLKWVGQEELLTQLLAAWVQGLLDPRVRT